MKLLNFRIKNFRSIKDSGNCFLSNDITVLAGKNESGKTNILEALNKFSLDEKFTPLDYPLDDKNSVIEITLKFSIGKDDVNDILNMEELRTYVYKDSYLEITKSSKETEYLFSGSCIEIIKQSLNKRRISLIKSMMKQIDIFYKIYEKNGVDIGKKLSISKSTKDVEFTSIVDSFIGFLKTNREKIVNLGDSNRIDNFITELEDMNYEIDIDKQIKSIKKNIIDSLPKFILFKSFEDILPHEIELSSANKKIIKDFEKLSGLQVSELIKDVDTHKRRTHVDLASASINGNFSGFWNQDEVKVVVGVDGSKLTFSIYDKKADIPFRPDQRSKGLQWFISFYITLNAELESDKQSIILIDEPGLYLHSKAQEDVLRVLESIAEGMQIIFTTHMPYLIDPNRLDRVKLIIKDESSKETIILDKTHKNADSDTLTPIITAIGLDLSKGLNLSKTKNLLLEGISDYYIIRSLTEYINDVNKKDYLKDVNIIPCVGATKIPLIASLFKGWGLDFRVLLDNDREGRLVHKTLRDRLLVDENDIVFVTDNRDESIEDLFSKQDFSNYIFKIKTGSKELNSILIKKHKVNKALKSKLFYDMIKKKEVKLTGTTTKNFENIMQKL